MEEQLDESPENATRKVTVRFTQQEYDDLEKAFQNTTKQKFSQYVRAILLQKKIVTKTRNESLDKFIFEMINLRTELSTIGKNINQAVRKLHSLSYLDEIKSWTKNFGISHDELLEKVSQINTRIAQISDTWSPESPA